MKAGLLGLLISGPVFASDHTTHLPKVASTDLCADQYLVSLAARDQIISLSDQSRSPVGIDPEGKLNLPRNRAQAEEFLQNGTELVILKQYGDVALEKMLHRFGIDTLRLPYAATINDVKAAVRLVASRIGRQAAGEQAITDLNRAITHANTIAKGHPRLTALYLRPDGGGTGSGTFVHAALDAAGFNNLQADLGQKGWASLPLEKLAVQDADIIVTSFFDNPLPSASNRKVNHPLISRFLAGKPRFDVPGHLWICGGPGVAEAVTLLADFAADLHNPENKP